MHVLQIKVCDLGMVRISVVDGCLSTQSYLKIKILILKIKNKKIKIKRRRRRRS
jgi:hypothetical protein